VRKCVGEASNALRMFKAASPATAEAILVGYDEGQITLVQVDDRAVMREL
jgi:hypothetical protein